MFGGLINGILKEGLMYTLNLITPLSLDLGKFIMIGSNYSQSLPATSKGSMTTERVVASK
jgi:hypothetical protein